jgi:uncharacterized protein with beta-barrel porin domain
MFDHRSRDAAGSRTHAVSWLLLLAALLGAVLPITQALAQSVTIPLQYLKSDGWRLGINVGINGGTPQLYMFDTGSSVFNAMYNPATWQGFGPTAPAATVPDGSGINYCYGSPPCYNGNLVQVPVLNFYAAGATASSAPAATLTASPGFQINAVYNATNESGTRIEQTYPEYFLTHDRPPLQDAFYGIFGAGNFASRTNTPAIVGGVLGQAMIPGVLHQGYVVSANGQPNPATYDSQGAPTAPYPNPPGGNQIVTIGGQSQQVSPCVACVTVGLTPQLVGQFAAVSASSQAGLVPWGRKGVDFPNPFSSSSASGTGNPGSIEFGSRFTTTLPSGNGTVSHTGYTLLDSGTPYYAPSDQLSAGSVSDGSVLSISGATPVGGTIPGIPTTNSTLGPRTDSAYEVFFNSGSDAIIGIPFFMQNSVMFDLTGNTIGYTPFYVTAANLATTAGGPLIVGAGNVPLGIAGVISGPGGLVINSGGSVQLSATNSYTGLTTIGAASGGTPAGLLLVSGPGSIASSSGVVNDGVLDISRAWQAVAIQSLAGGGQVYLGGQNLLLTNASGTFSGSIGDGGAYPAVGGSLTLAGGSFTLAGNGSYTGGTFVSGGTFTLSGSLSGGVDVMPQGSLTVASGGVLTGTVLNRGSFINNGMVNGSLATAGMLSGGGVIAGNVANSGIIAPGSSIGTLTIGGNYVHMASATYSAEVASNGQSDLITVGGGAALQGGTLSIYAQPGTTFGARTTYRILSSAGGIAGTFATMTNPYPFLLSSLTYDANNVYLTMQIGGFGQVAANATQAAVGRVLDANVNTASGDFAQVLSSMATNTTSPVLGQATLTSLSGQNYSSFSSTMVLGAQLFLNNFAGQAGGATPASSRVALAEACDVACDVTPTATWGAWGGALGGLGSIGAASATGTVSYNAGGFAAGLDRVVAPGTRLGVTAGYITGTQWTSGFTGQGTTDTFLAGMYGGYSMDRFYADAVLGYAYSSNQMWRQISVPGLQPRTAQGRTGANQWYGQIEGGYRFDMGSVSGAVADAYITPFVRLSGYTGTTNGFTETGAQSLNLTVAGQTTDSLKSVIGAQLGTAVDLGWREKLVMQFRLGWSHEYASVSRPVTATLAGAPLMPFTTYGPSPTRDGAVVGFFATSAIATGASVYLRYEGTISGSDSAHGLVAGVRMSW